MGRYPKRCHYYNSQGYPRKSSGCPRRSSCRFAHPEDPEWSQLPPIYPPKHFNLPSTPTRSLSPTMLPPPPRPPSIISAPAPPTPQPSSEEKSKVWTEKIDLFAELHTVNDEYDRLKDQVRHIELIRSRNPNPSQQSSARYDELVRKRDGVKSRREELYNRLTESGSWPAGPPSKFDEKQEAQMKGVVKLATDLSSAVEEMERLVKELSAKKDDDVPLNEMGVGPSLKRRRVEDGSAEDVPPSAPAPPPPPAVPQEEIDAVQHTLAKLESQLSTLQNDLAAQYADTKEAVSDLLDLRDEEKSSTSNEPQQQFADIKEEVDGLGSQLEELASEMAKLIVQTDDDEKQMKALAVHNEQIQSDIASLQTHIEKAEQDRDRDEREIAALSAALSAYVERPPSPPASPFEIEHVLPYLEQPLTQLVRGVIQSHIDQFRNDLQTRLHQQDQELYDTLWSKLDLTLRMVRVVAETVKRPPAS